MGKTDVPAATALAAAADTPAARALWRRLEAGGVCSCSAVHPAAMPFLAALVRHAFPRRPVVAVTDGLKTQELFQQDIETWTRLASSAAPPQFYPPWDVLPHEDRLPHADIISERLETLVALHRHASGGALPAPLIVTSVIALLQRTFRPGDIAARTRVLRRGDRLDPLDLVEWLEDQGYEPEVQVNARGDIALRGGIVDVFPLTASWPVRLEFFGDELESLRTFDPVSQMSKETIDTVTLPPGGELGLIKRTTTQPATLLEHLPGGTLFLLCQPESIDEHAARYAELVPAGDAYYVPWEAFQRQGSETGMTFLSLPGPTPDEVLTPVVVDDGSLRRESETDGLRFESLDAFRPVVERAPEPQVAAAQRREFFAQIHRWLRQDHAVHICCNNEGERQRFEEIWKEYGFDELPQEADEAGKLQAAVPPASLKSSPTPRAARARLQVHLGALSRGFLHADARLVVVTDAEIFGRYKVQRPRRLKSPHAQTSRSLLDIDFTDLEEGDFVVHLEHGIGRYLGLQQMPASGGDRRLEKAPLTDGEQECLVIEYAPNDPDQPAPKLYVPVSESHLVSKYVGAGKARPPLNTLGGGRWQKTKDHAERAVRDLAAELLAVQAARAVQPGHAFKPDAPWQREFESAFLYEETPDQWKAILAAKADMEAPRPMDRLICGDVGYGKTEVAIRAAFKAVMDGRQVAVLVPTTVLAQQHFNTFRERMADYPVRIDLLSRFRSARAQRQTLQDLATGAVDIVIGTHRLVQDDVAFKELGLVVIDEEQRFGVLHKEKFKLLRKLVDVLTLSATPIPRTLYLALTGARDMSTIETPPQDRLPVETIVTEYDERVIRDAIQRELNRGGQVFYLHNRVFDIENVALRLRALLPRARIAVGHGQMHADDLEEVMTRFVNGEADVLLSTTIIESGIDIPNANTIIIDRADRFGLSDLYQLRGRVGRYKHQAYAYLLVPRHARLLTDARKRISAIKQYSTLGSGFKIAMRDLEIRGAGNLLGAQQSGHITAVGFDLYCQLLKHSVSALKGERIPSRAEVRVDLDFLPLNAEDGAPVTASRPVKSAVRSSAGTMNVSVPREVATHVATRPLPAARPSPPAVRPQSACLPAAYVPDAKQRIDIHRKLAGATSEEDLNRLKAELRDRFGPLPAAVELLLRVAELITLARGRGVTAIASQDDRLMMTRHGEFVQPGGKFPRLTKKDPRARLNEIKRLLQSLR